MCKVICNKQDKTMNMKKEVQGFIGTLPFGHASNRV